MRALVWGQDTRRSYCRGAGRTPGCSTLQTARPLSTDGCSSTAAPAPAPPRRRARWLAPVRVCNSATGHQSMQQAASVQPELSPQLRQQLSQKDRQMVRLYLAGCFHKWDDLPDIAAELLATGCSAEELRGCVRHLIVFAGYAPCLAATLALQKAGLLPEDTPAKCGGPPGNAFELVYASVTDLVRKKMHAADPAVGEWIRTQAYGDVYSSPGLDLRQKQLLGCAFLGVAAMPDQLLGHAIAGLRFGCSRAELEEAVRLGFEQGTAPQQGAEEEALRMVEKAYLKYAKDFSDQHSPSTITIPDPASVRVPPLPPLYNTPASTGGPDPTASSS